MRRPCTISSPAPSALPQAHFCKAVARFRKGETASNETFAHIDIPDHPARSVLTVLKEQVSPVIVNGYRKGEGIDAERYPTKNACAALEELTDKLATSAPDATKFTAFARGEASYEQYVEDLRSQLEKQGGGWVTVAPRDTCQQGNDSESAADARFVALPFQNRGFCMAFAWRLALDLEHLARERGVLGAESGLCRLAPRSFGSVFRLQVGYETGGAQYQAGLIRGFDPATILRLGLPYNMPAHSLQRSQYVNGLAELTPEIRRPLFESTADLVSQHYRGSDAASTTPES